MNDIYDRELVVIDMLRALINDATWKVKSEFSTNDNDTKVVVVQEQTGNKVIFYGNCQPIYNYYQIKVFGTIYYRKKI